MSYNDDLERYELEAEDQFDDYDDPYGEDDFDSGLEGYEDSYQDEEDGFYEEEVEYLPAMEEDGYDSYDDDDYDSYKATSIGKIDANDRTLTVVVANTSGADAEAILFGGNQDAAQPAGVTVVVEESSHKEVREESKANPFKIQGMKMSSSDALQFDNVLKITRRTATGSNTTRVYQPRNATSPQNFSQSLIDDSSFEMDVTGQDSMRFNVRNGATVVFTFTIKARANMGNLLKGHNVAELSRAPRTTGLPQLDLLQRKKKKKKPAMKKVTRRIPIKGRKKAVPAKRKRR